MNSFKIIYQDDQLMVIDKPAGLVVDPSNTSQEVTLAEILTQEYKIKVERGGIVHRLDKDTSGLLITAKTPEALSALQSQFKNRQVKKEYTVLAHGYLEEKIEVDGPIARNPYDRERFVVVGSQTRDFKEVEGKEAKTIFTPIKKMVLAEDKLLPLLEKVTKIQMRKLHNLSYFNYTLIKAEPLTGRTHQIRVHLKYAGFPLVSDEKYGGRKVVRLDKRWCKRQFLHASRLEFKHPISEKIVTFESQLPYDLKEALNFLSEAN